jgi:hypothetical protein
MARTRLKPKPKGSLFEQKPGSIVNKQDKEETEMKEEKRYLGLTLALGLGLAVLLGFMGGTRPPAALAQAGTGIIRVATSGDDVPGCGSEAAPCRSVQYAVDEALPYEQIRVAAGLYTGVQARPAPPDYEGPAVITQVVYLSKTLSLQGGYTLTNWAEPDPEANPTILDAQGQGRVLLIAGTISPTVEGLRLTGGDATGLSGALYWNDSGGGVYVHTAIATISGCVIYNNTISTVNFGAGGGLYLHESNSTIEGNMITGNTANTAGPGTGGGLSLQESDATLLGNTVQGNTASTAGDGHGGGLYLNYSHATLEGNTVQGNIASTDDDHNGDGGGLGLYGSDATLEGNTVQGNTANSAGDGEGGGLHLYYSNATLRGNTVQDNTASPAGYGEGGGLYLFHCDASLSGNRVQGNTASTAGDGHGGGLGFYYQCNVTLKSNVIISNTANTTGVGYNSGGGLVVCDDSSLTLINNVVAGNQANEGSGLRIRGSSDSRLSHNTIADNAAIDDSGQGVYVDEFTTLTFTNTLISGHDGVGIAVIAGSTAILEGTLWHGNGADTGGTGTIVSGTVNVYDDPAFVDPSAGDYHLGPSSAAIDAGIDAGISTDIDGDPRPLGPGFDIGADEYFVGGVRWTVYLPLMVKDH